MDSLAVTVGIPFHSNTRLIDLLEAVESIQKQDVKVQLIHLLQDGEVSSDLEKYASDLEANYDNVRYSKLKKAGLPTLLNFSIDKCDTPYYARMDSDDVSFLHRIRTQYEYLESHQEISILGAWAEEFSSEKGMQNSILKKTPTDPLEMVEWFHYRNPFIHSTVMFRVSVFKKIGMYRADFKTDQDLELWGRAINHSIGMANISQALIYFRTDNMLLKRSKLDAVFRQLKARYTVPTWSIRLNILKIFALVFRLTPRIIREVGYKYLR